MYNYIISISFVSLFFLGFYFFDAIAKKYTAKIYYQNQYSNIITSLRKSVNESYEARNKTGKKSFVIQNPFTGLFQTVSKKALKQNANKKNRTINHRQIKELHKESIYATR